MKANSAITSFQNLEISASTKSAITTLSLSVKNYFSNAEGTITIFHPGLLLTFSVLRGYEVNYVSDCTEIPQRAEKICVLSSEEEKKLT